MNRTERLHALTESLRRAGGRGRTAEQLAAEFEVTTRTVKRDLAALAAGGLPVWSRTGPGGGYGLAEAASMRPVSLSAAQVLALGAAVTAASRAPYADAAGAALRKILDGVDPATRRRAEELTSRVWVDVEPGPPRRILSVLEQALLEQRVVRLRYRDGRDRVTRRDVEPMIAAMRRGRWFLVGWCRLRDAVRWFDMARIESATGTRLPCAGHRIAEIGAPPPTATAATI